MEAVGLLAGIAGLLSAVVGLVALIVFFFLALNVSRIRREVIGIRTLLQKSQDTSAKKEVGGIVVKE